uniref:Uncharacterized protein n=1 Tax=Arion vulgaris TaxID=1028688 RepID=A0A0B7C0S0_9EUPU
MFSARMVEIGVGKHLEMKYLIIDNSGRSFIVIYTDGSMLQGKKSGWGFLTIKNKIIV